MDHHLWVLCAAAIVFNGVAASYYVYYQHLDPLDERFAFRMFSSVDLSGTAVTWWTQTIADNSTMVQQDAARLFGRSWKSKFRNGSPLSVLDRLSVWLCSHSGPPLKSVAYERRFTPWTNRSAAETRKRRLVC